MYVARYAAANGPVVQAGFELHLPAGGAAAAAAADPVARLAGGLEERTDLAVVVARPLGRAAGPPFALVAAPAADETSLRALLVEWCRLDEIAPGTCRPFEDRASYDAALPTPEAGFAITNTPVERDGVVFHPHYRLHERLEVLDRLLLRLGGRALACFRPAHSRADHLAIRQNLVRLGRGWVPDSLRAEQTALAETYLTHGLLLDAFVFCLPGTDATSLFDLLARDAAATRVDRAFPEPPVQRIDDTAPEFLGIELLSLESGSGVRVGNAIAPGVLRQLLHVSHVRQPAKGSVAPPAEPYRVFISYAHEDRSYADRLRVGCVQLRRDGWIDDWIDGDIAPGEVWEQEITDRLETADLVILLISPDFLASEFCYGIELRRALERQVEGRAVVVPVVVRHADIRTAPFAHVQALPTGLRPISTWPDPDEGWLDVISGLRRTLERAPRLLAAKTGGGP